MYLELQYHLELQWNIIQYDTYEKKIVPLSSYKCKNEVFLKDIIKKVTK